MTQSIPAHTDGGFPHLGRVARRVWPGLWNADDEIYLFSSPRPIRTLHNAVGWTTAIAGHNSAGAQAIVHAARPLGRRFSLNLL
jgi:hypothetical protein